MEQPFFPVIGNESTLYTGYTDPWISCQKSIQKGNHEFICLHTVVISEGKGLTQNIFCAHTVNEADLG